MRLLIIGALVGAPVSQAGGATLESIETAHARAGAFAGARVRLDFGGRWAGKAQASLGIGPTRLALQENGRLRSSFGEGVSFGFRQGEGARLSLAGRTVREHRLAADEAGERKGGVPTWVWIVGGTVVVIGVAGALALDYLSDQSE